MFSWFCKPKNENSKWNIKVEEALQKYPNACAIIKEMNFDGVRFISPVEYLLSRALEEVIERLEKLEKNEQL